MKKQLILIFSLLIFSLNSKAQDETKFYKILFAYADSLSKTGQKGIVSKEIYGIIENLDKNHPSGFFEKSGELINEGKFNEASLVFYIGYFRYRYFNLANPDYKPSEDGALLSSLKSIMQEPINLFLRTDIDNFIKILENCKEWLTKNDYSYFSKNKDIQKYSGQLTQVDDLIKDFSIDKIKFQAQWAKEQIEYLKLIDPENKLNPKK